jgi:peptide/nickel transport system substrate-binding protein
MFRIKARASFAAALATLAWGLTPAASQAADRVLNVSSASTITTMDPYAESESQLYFIWCQVYGCLGRLDYEKKAFVGMLAEKWEVVNNSNTWRLYLFDVTWI